MDADIARSRRKRNGGQVPHFVDLDYSAASSRGEPQPEGKPHERSQTGGGEHESPSVAVKQMRSNPRTSGGPKVLRGDVDCCGQALLRTLKVLADKSQARDRTNGFRKAKQEPQRKDFG